MCIDSVQPAAFILNIVLMGIPRVVMQRWKKRQKSSQRLRRRLLILLKGPQQRQQQTARMAKRQVLLCSVSYAKAPVVVPVIISAATLRDTFFTPYCFCNKVGLYLAAWLQHCMVGYMFCVDTSV